MELATIVPVQKGVKIGYKNRLSNLDIKQANRMYNCPGKVFTTVMTTIIVCMVKEIYVHVLKV